MRIRFILLLVAVLLFAGSGAYFVNSDMGRRYAHRLKALMGTNNAKRTNGPVRSNMENNILKQLNILEISDSTVSFNRLPGDTAIEIRASVPRGKPVELIVWQLSTAVAGTSYKLDDCFCPPDDRGCSLRFTSTVPGQPAIALDITWAARYFSKSAKIAVVIKDFGFAADQTTIDYLSFPEPLTVALVPSRKLSSWTAKISKEYKKEIVILQPMEPQPAQRTTDDRQAACVMIHYPEERLQSIIDNAVKIVPDFSGFCNSGGARVLEDSRVMAILFNAIKKRHGYFIEERMSRKSVAPAIARKVSLPYLPIDCLIDTTMKAARIRELLYHCAAEAQKRGHIVICSRASEAFIRTLKNELPLLKQNGIRLSYVSDIITPIGAIK